MIQVENLNVMFGHGRNSVQAVRNASFAVAEGESFGLVGESGSGKSTVLRAIAGLHSHWTGTIAVDGVDLLPKRPREFRKLLQIVFQDPFGSLHPRHTVDFILKEPLAIHGFDNVEERTLKALDEVGLGPEFRFRYPHQISGGMRQRVAIARALINRPSVLLADEPTGNLDEKTADTVMELLLHLCRDETAALVLVTHNPLFAKRADRQVTLSGGRFTDQ